MRESIVQTTVNKILTWLAKKSVTALYKRTSFWTFSWGLDENTDLHLFSEELYLDRHRFGTYEEVYGQAERDIYPLVIVRDRYSGSYSYGAYTAWNMFFDDIPQDIDGDDVSCYCFWNSYNGTVGLGETPNGAVKDLRQKLNAQTERNE